MEDGAAGDRSAVVGTGGLPPQRGVVSQGAVGQCQRATRVVDRASLRPATGLSPACGCVIIVQRARGQRERSGAVNSATECTAARSSDLGIANGIIAEQAASGQPEYPLIVDRAALG